MLYEELCARTRGLATYEQFKAIETIYTTSSIDKDDAAMLWYLSYGRDTQFPPQTLDQRTDYVRRMSAAEKRRLFWTVYESEQPLIFDKVTGLNFTLLVGNKTKSPDYHYLHLALYHCFDVRSGKITVIPTGFREFGNVMTRWHPIRSGILIKTNI